MTTLSNKKSQLTSSELLFIKQYQEKEYHRFKEIYRYVYLLEKLTNL